MENTIKYTVENGLLYIKFGSFETVMHLGEYSTTINGKATILTGDGFEAQIVPFSENAIELRITRCEPMPKELYFPGSIQHRPEDLCLYPYGEGMVFRADDAEFLFPERMSFHGASTNTMSFYGFTRGEAWLLCATITNADAELAVSNSNGMIQEQQVWLPQKGELGYERSLRIYAGENGGITAMCSTYRGVAEEKGFVCTIDEKLKDCKRGELFRGAADVWLWNDNAMDKLYNPQYEWREPTADEKERRFQIASEMKALGMDRVLWSVFDETVDKELIARVKSLGYLTTYYDIYTDVIDGRIADLIPEARRRRCEPRFPWWPKGIRKKEDGSPAEAWALMGKDGSFHSQQNLCDAEAYKCARTFAHPHTTDNGFDARFIDVIMIGAEECWDEKHPMTRSEAFRYKRKLLRELCDLGIFVGNEIGREEAVPETCYNEGLLSPTKYRAYDAGRRMTHIYEGEGIDPLIKQYMLNPVHRVPLWELVYHDCMVSYWYWGDSTCCCPELTLLRDLFCILWGQPPIYSFAAMDWERLKPFITESYMRVSPVARLTFGKRMLSHRYMTEDMLVQETCFEGGITVTVNFSEREYDGIPAMDYRIINA